VERDIEKRFTGRVIDWMNYRFDGRGYLTDPRDSAATAPRELYLVPREGGTPRRLTSLGVNVQSAQWSPDGKRLAFVADSHQRDEYSYGRADVWTVTSGRRSEAAHRRRLRLQRAGLDRRRHRTGFSRDSRASTR
jgi:dipeptidyl aminopeptidase/acylaminoacyl peptidase